MQHSLAQHCLLEKSPTLISSSSVMLVVNIYVVRQRAIGGGRKTAWVKRVSQLNLFDLI